mgnify:CR=1 FL=1
MGQDSPSMMKKLTKKREYKKFKKMEFQGLNSPNKNDEFYMQNIDKFKAPHDDPDKFYKSIKWEFLHYKPKEYKSL